MTERIFRYLREQQPETPCLVIDLDVVENNFRRMRELLPTAHIFYAVKANPAAQVLARLATAGSKFDTANLSFDQRLGAGQFGIGRPHLPYQGGHQLVHHHILRAQLVRMAHGPAHDPAQHIAAPFV